MKSKRHSLHFNHPIDHSPLLALLLTFALTGALHLPALAKSMGKSVAAVAVHDSTAVRQVTTLTDGWVIRPITSVAKRAAWTPVSLPHTWNAEPKIGTPLYERTTMVYRRTLQLSAAMQGHRVFLYFEGVNSVAHVFVNRLTVGEHRGGYTAFCLEITDYIKEGENLLEVWVSNAYRTDVLPISGDFNINGGIHRPCHLIVTSPVCISPTFFASPGVLVRQEKVSDNIADLGVETHLQLRGRGRESGDRDSLRLQLVIADAEGQTVATATTAVTDTIVNQSLHVDHPRLWDGKANPYLYTLTARLYRGEAVVDEVCLHTGLRYYSVDLEQGFSLNGHPLDLHGFCRHEDIQERASALLPAYYQLDMDLVEEVGATAMRLAHYTHGQPMYDLSDRHGIVLWTEIPLCGPGGQSYTGYLDSPGLKANARQTLQELVYQNLHHPSVVFWGICNEILVTDGGKFEAYDDPIPFIKELNNLFHTIDPSRLTALATCVDQRYYLGCSDLLAWNKYFGWYKDAAPSAVRFFDDSHAAAGSIPVGVSEYGAGASIHHHQWPLQAEDRADSHFHPEEAQSWCHEGNWAAFAERPYLWAKFIWVFADFPSYMRSEGEADGYNDKGLLTRDRQTRKDAFYFYKANWNAEPMLYLTSRRYIRRTQALTDIKIYTTLPQATLFINSQKVGTAMADSLHRIVWEGITLSPGRNIVRVEGRQGKTVLTDEATWFLVDEP